MESPTHSMEGDEAREKVKAALLETLTRGDAIFQHAISNPPYQAETGTPKASGARTSVDIYPAFQLLASTIAGRTTMVYPASWQKNIQWGLGKHLLDNGLMESRFYPSQEIFDRSIRENFPISVVLSQRGYSGEVRANGVSIPRDIPVWIDSPLTKAMLEASKKWSGEHLGGVVDEVAFSNVEYAREGGLVVEKNPDEFHAPVELYIKAKPGKQPDGSIWYVERESVPPGVEIDTHRVCVRSALIGRLGHFNDAIATCGNIDLRLYPASRVHSTTHATIKGFSTEAEARNFKAYLESECITALVKLDFSKKGFASYVPDLEDYTIDNPLFMEDDHLPPGHEYRGVPLEKRLRLFYGVEKYDG